MKTRKPFLVILTCLFLLAGCAVNETAQESSLLNEEAYPAAGEEDETPVTETTNKNEEAYPAAGTDLGNEPGPEFYFNLPIVTGDTVVTGTGPAGVTIMLVNVSEEGLTLGETVIEEDGTFTFTLEEPLQSGHSIGIKLGSVEGTEFDESDFLYSETYYEEPMIGILFDLVTIE